MQLPTRRDLFAVGRRTINGKSGLRINPKVIDVEGSDLNILIGMASVMGEHAVARFAANHRNLFVETAEGARLDRVAFDRYQVTRKPASPSRVDLRISRPTSGAGAGTYPQGSRVTTTNGTQFALDEDAAFGASDLSKTVSATALVSGPSGQVPANTLTTFLDSPFDATLTVTNLLGAAGGLAAETDPEFKGRVFDFFPTIRRGVLGAIEYTARTVAGVAVATATEVVNPDENALPAGMVQLIVADKDGGTSTVIRQAVLDALLEARALGIPVLTSGGIVSYEPVTWDLTFDVGVNTVQKTEEVRAVTVASTQFLKPGAPLLRSSLIAAARAVPGVTIRNESLVAPAGDVEPLAIDRLIRVRKTDVSFV